ncbi:MAG: glycosyltransferase [Pseudomonadota bacterium]
MLLTFIPYFVDEEGSIWLDRLWQHDLQAHFEYLHNLVLAAPRGQWPTSATTRDLVKLVVPSHATLSTVQLPPQSSTLQSLLRLPQTAWRLWRAIGRVTYVHSGVAGWPYPLGWVANPIALVRGKKLITVVESAPWRLQGDNAPLRDRLRASVTEFLARYFVSRADLRLFTQAAYERTLSNNNPRGPGFVTPASWINEEDILTPDQTDADWAKKTKEQPIRLLFPTRLQESKGVNVLLDAISNFDIPNVAIDIIGQGPLREKCEDYARKHSLLSVMTPVPYGEEFFDLLRRYHAVLVPSVSDEQPRILFDSFARAVPIIGSATDGIAPHVTDNRTGWLAAPGDVDQLRELIQRAAETPEHLHRMGLNARESAYEFTHHAMHVERSRIFAEHLL